MRMQVIQGRFPFSQKFRKFRFGAKCKTFFLFARLENSQKKWNCLEGSPGSSTFLEISRSGEPKERFPFSPEPEFSEFLTKWKAPLDSLFARPGSAPIGSGKKGEFGDWITSSHVLFFLLQKKKQKQKQTKTKQKNKTKQKHTNDNFFDYLPKIVGT